LLLVDSALGLPKILGVPFQQLLERAREYEYQGKKYGAETASLFFQDFLDRARWQNHSYPQRLAERRLNANSVFQRYPFQKNIGCGTYRILKDLSQNPGWYRVWPFDCVLEADFIIAEGYPSFLWKELLGTHTRKADRLFEFLKQHFPDTQMPRTPDDADATVLALAARQLVESDYLAKFDYEKIPKHEGWIFGLTPS
jgi:hypothetical protein